LWLCGSPQALTDEEKQPYVEKLAAAKAQYDIDIKAGGICDTSTLLTESFASTLFLI
jgi:hypothetical protein